MAQSLKATVAVPLPESLPGGLLASSQRLEGPWQRGVEFVTSACIPGNLYPFCAESPVEKAAGTANTGAEFESVGTYVVVNCSTLGGRASRDDLRNYGSQALAIQAETQLALELATGTVTGNVALVDGTDVGSAATPVEALALLENELADILGNVKGTIHMSPGMLTTLYAAGAIIQNLNGGFTTANGNVVIASPGYAGLTAIHGTGPIYANHQTDQVLEDVERSQNTLTVRAEGIGIVAFDPCANIYVEIGGS